MTYREPELDEIKKRINSVRKRISQAARKAGRDPSDIRLLAVTKTHGPELVKKAISAGLGLFGENYIQEAKDKIEAIGGVASQVKWHFIGHLQRNKAKWGAALFECVQTVDNKKLAEALDRHAKNQGKVLSILCQVNLAGETQKSGASPDDLPALLEHIMTLPHLSLEGLMLVPPYNPDPEATRAWFAGLRRLRDKLSIQMGLQEQLRELSMGMTHDFEVAIEEGATIIRVGTALFGPRVCKR